MRVLVDARQIYRPERRGIGKTMLQLYGTLSRIRPDWEFRLLHQLEFQVPELSDCKNVRSTRVDFPGSHRSNLWENILLPTAAWALGADVLHSPANTGPRSSRVPVVLHLHDLIPLDLSTDRADALAWAKHISQAVRGARHVLTGSEYSRQRIIETLKTPAEKVSVQPWAPHPLLRNRSESTKEKSLSRFGLSENDRYLFAFGANDPRKNTRLILETYSALSDKLREQAKLLIVGLQEPALSSLKQLVQQRGLTAQVHLSSFAPEEDIPILLSGAIALIYASSYEGFGLPILDAFACGTPVIAGNRTSIPEVAGEAAALVDLDDSNELRHQMERMLVDSEWRSDLKCRGLDRAKLYSWERTAEGVAIVFERFAKRARP
jgi:glycosyltransferase involved in cell wall biosynthesis